MVFLPKVVLSELVALKLTSLRFMRLSDLKRMAYFPTFASCLQIIFSRYCGAWQDFT
jgi:hypothetical protein